MDYHVFVLSRVREAVQRGMTTHEAVAHGVGRSAGVVTSAALVMVAVFGSFALLPATMTLLGERNWYLPRRLDGLPALRREAQAAPAA